MPLIAISQALATRSEKAPGGRNRPRERKVMPYLLELLDSTLVNTTALVDQVTGSGRFAGIDVTDNDDVDMNLLFTHVCGIA